MLSAISCPLCGIRRFIIGPGERSLRVRVLNYLELADRLRRSGISTAVDNQRKALADSDHRLLTTPWAGGSPASAGIKSALGDAAFESYDLAHCNLVGPGTIAVAEHAKRNEIPLVLHAHVTREDFAGSFRGSNAVGPALERYLRWLYSRADLVLCPSAYTKSVLDSYPIDAPIRPVTNGVDVESLAGHEDRREQYRRRFDLEGLVVFAVGNVFERKGVSTFCRLAERTNYEFVWFGPYDTGLHADPTVRRLVRSPPQNVTFTGWIEDIRGAYGAGDIYLFPTKVENQGIAVLEAMACGAAVVLRDIPVFEEFYTDGEDCLKCATLSEFEAALGRLAADPDLRERLGENAKSTARRHDLDRVRNELLDAYDVAQEMADCQVTTD
jgi:1,2-diacylglycerol-3-alpha-glucose alpha-1,2-glucosyltransferase